MRPSVRVLLVLAFVCVWMLAAAGVAAAEPIDTSTARTAVQFWPEGEPTSTVIIVTLELPDDTPLPATVRLPVPAGTTITWAGEIMGGSIENDLPRPFQLVEGTGGQSVEFTLEQTRTAQYDATYVPVVAENGQYDARLDWTQTEPTEDVQFNVRMPGTVTDIVIEPAPAGEPDANAFGERLYKLSPITIAPGENAAVTVAYARPELGDSGGSTFDERLPWLLGILGVAVVALLIAAVMSARRQGGDDSGEDAS